MSLGLADAANAVFFISGVIFVPIYQQAAYWGFNEPTSCLAPYIFFFCMLFGGLFQVCFDRRCSESSTESEASQRYSDHQVKLCIGIAVLTVMDNVMSICSIVYIGGMLYSIIYGWVVVATAIIRRVYLKRSHTRCQWLGITIVSAGLSIAGISGDKGGKGGVRFIVGVCAVLFASTCDAFMYVCVERLLGQKAGIGGVVHEVSASELTLIVGVVGSTMLAPVGWIYAVTGYWQETLYKPMHDDIGGQCTAVLGVEKGHEPSTSLVVICWLCGGIVMYIHYYAFYLVVKATTNSVVAGIAKSVQAAAIFFTNALLFSYCDDEQSVTLPKVLAAMAVIAGALLYSLFKAPQLTPNSLHAPMLPNE